MREVKLTNGYVALVDDEDYELVSKFKWNVCINRGTQVYAQTTLKMHRLVAKPGPDQVVDHLDGDGLNNTKANLEVVSPGTNVLRTRKFPRNKTGFRGVHLSAGKYRAEIAKGGKAYRLGSFDTCEEAAAAYDEAAIELYGEEAPKSKIPNWVPPRHVPIEELRVALSEVGVL